MARMFYLSSAVIFSPPSHPWSGLSRCCRQPPANSQDSNLYLSRRSEKRRPDRKQRGSNMCVMSVSVCVYFVMYASKYVYVLAYVTVCIYNIHISYVYVLYIYIYVYLYICTSACIYVYG